MAINTIKLTGVTVYMGQGSFLFYKKSSTGVTNTDVDVFVDNNYITTMSPTDHFNVDRVFGQIRLVPADLNNQAIFISADKAEEYGTAAVAGAVAITSAPVIIQSPDALNMINGGSYVATQITSQVGSSLSTSIYFLNATTSPDTYYVKSIVGLCYDTITGDQIPFKITALPFSHSKIVTTGPNYGFRKSNLAANAASEITTSLPAGFVGLFSSQYVTENTAQEAPIRIGAGLGLNLVMLYPSTPNIKTCAISVHFST